MKHVRCVLAFLIAILILAGCSVATPATTTQSTTATTAPALPEGIRNIIIVIGDGMGDAHLQLGEQASGKELVFRDWTLIHSNTNSFNSSGEAIKTTDSAAGGTALATGQLTTNGKVGRDSSGLVIIRDIAGDDRCGDRLKIVQRSLAAVFFVLIVFFDAGSACDAAAEDNTDPGSFF